MPSFFPNRTQKNAHHPEPPLPAIPRRLPEPPTILTAMNPASPFALNAGEQFTVRELMILLPPQFVRGESLPGDQTVPLPLELLRASLQQGRPALRLSQIYLACPSLFSRQVPPAEDMEIVLPFQKVKRMLENSPAGSPFTAVAPPRSAESPFMAGSSPFLPAGGPASAAASPFAARVDATPPGNEVLAPFNAEMPSLPEAPPAAPNPFQRMEAPGAAPRPASSPFQLVAPAAGAPGSAPVPVLPMSTPSPFARMENGGNGGPAPDKSAGPEPPAPVNPFQAAPAPAPQHPPVATPPRESAGPNGPSLRNSSPVPAGPVIRVLLSTLLRDVTAQDLGFEPSAVPDHVEAVLSLDAIMPQLSTGRVEISVEELRQGVEERFRPAFARVRPGLRFVVPLSEVFRSLPPDAIPAPQGAHHVPISTSPFQTPFTLRADDEANGGKPPLPQFVAPAPPAPAHPVTHFPVIPTLTDTPGTGTGPVKLPAAPAAAPSGSAEPAPPAPAQTRPAAPEGESAIKLPGLPPLPQLSGAPVRPSPFSRPPGMAPPAAPADSRPESPAVPLPPVAPASLPKLPSLESHDDLGQPFNAASLQSEPPAKPSAPEPFDPSKLFTGRPAAKPHAAPPAAPAVSAAPAAPAAPPAPAPPAPRRPAAAPAASAPPIEFNFGETPDLARVTLRAIFDTDEDLAIEGVVDRLAKLPGVRAAVAIINGRTVAGHGEGGEEHSQFSSTAAKSCEYLSGLAESMGCGTSGSFTLRAGKGVRTFFLEAGNCLAVLHGESAFAPGVRDKLLLTARLLQEIAA